MKNLIFLSVLFFFSLIHEGRCQQIDYQEGRFYEVDRCDACETCSSGMGDRVIERKNIAAFCDGKDIGAWTITHTTICPSRRYTSTHFKEYYTVSSSYKRFRSESAAMQAIREEAGKLCFGGSIQEGYTSKEVERAARKKEQEEREKRHAQLMEDYKNGKIIPDTSRWRNKIPTPTLSAEEIINYDWELKERGAFGIIVQTKKVSFKEDGTYHAEIFEALTSIKKEQGTWTLLDDQTVRIIHEARVSNLVERVTVYIEKLSFWEGIGRFGASSSKGNGTTYFANRIKRGAAAQVYNKLEGEWTLHVKLRSKRKPLKILMKLKKESNGIYGEYLDVEWSGRQVCKEAAITGSIENGQINLEVDYSGGCCPGLRFRLTGEMIREDQFFGKFSMIENLPRCNSSMNDARVTGHRGRAAFEEPATARISSGRTNGIAGSTLFNGTFETMDDWTVNAGDAKNIDGVAAIRPHKKKRAVALKSKTFTVPSKARYLSFGIDKSQVKTGDLKVLIIDTKTGAKETVYKESIRLSLNEINRAVGNLRLSKLTAKRTKRSVRIKSNSVDISKYRGKEVEIVFAYKAGGLSKAQLFLDDVSVR